MKILSIETSCDETAAAIISRKLKNNYVKILSNVVTSSLPYHLKTGGIVPEIAAREQLKYIIPVIKKALIASNLYPQSSKSNLLSSTIYPPDIDAIAVTVGPGLIGSLLVGIETAKTLAYLWKKPIIPVNHLLGHIYANFISTFNSQFSTINFPALALIVSGGHTDLILLKNHADVKWIGGTLDDAAGEAFDKIGRLLNLSYPGGPAIEEASKRGIVGRFTFPSPMIGSKDFNFSFSGLKAAVFRKVSSIKHSGLSKQVPDIAASVQQAIVDVLVRKTIKGALEHNAKSILLGGGVAANQKLKEEMHSQLLPLNFQLHVPPAHLCTDNAVMIGAYAAFNYKPALWKNITANPQLYF